MNIPYPNLPNGGDKTVYVRAVEVSELPQEVRDQAVGHDVLYSVHDANGQRLALVANKRLAFELARDNDYAPVSVH
ncbi:DUF1150 family protein [Celeribacter sp.]|uniref:DUF1150 family protein n=1 Tax=Celeribacter sp. TaxID=1890673 RepID=UPI003A92004D